MAAAWHLLRSFNPNNRPSVQLAGLCRPRFSRDCAPPWEARVRMAQPPWSPSRWRLRASLPLLPGARGSATLASASTALRLGMRIYGCSPPGGPFVAALPHRVPCARGSATMASASMARRRANPRRPLCSPPAPATRPIRPRLQRPFLPSRRQLWSADLSTEIQLGQLGLASCLRVFGSSAPTSVVLVDVKDNSLGGGWL